MSSWVVLMKKQVLQWGEQSAQEVRVKKRV
jgi:hypothetical protein